MAFATEATWHAHVVAEGFDALPAGRPHQEARAHFERFRAEIEALPEGQRRPHLFRRIFAEGHATAKLPELLEVARAWQPQAIVYESGDLAAPAVAAVLDVPTANHSFGVMVPFAAVAHAAKYMGPLWRSVGVEPDDYAGAFRGLYIDLSPPSFALEDHSATASGSGTRRGSCQRVRRRGWTSSSDRSCTSPLAQCSTDPRCSAS